jgi:hypothetical protein
MIVSTLEAVLTADISDFTTGLQQADRLLDDVAERMSARLQGLGASAPGASDTTGLLPSSLTSGASAVSDPLRDRVGQALDAVTGGEQGPLMPMISVAPELSIDTKALADQMQRFVDLAAASKTFKATMLADVTVLANKINLDRLIGSVSSAIDSIRVGAALSAGSSPGVPVFANGGVMPHEGLAYLHPGERVLTASQTRAYDGGRAGSGSVVVNAYGESPYELARMIDRARAEIGD